jgi:hypothetical protein
MKIARNVLPVLAALLFCAIADARPVHAPAYLVQDMDRAMLQARFIQAYVAAGFTLTKNERRSNLTTLEFSYASVKHTHKRGTATFHIRSESHDEQCAPCAIYYVTWGLKDFDYTSNRDDALNEEIKRQVESGHIALERELGAHYRLPPPRPASPPGID